MGSLRSVESVSQTRGRYLKVIQDAYDGLHDACLLLFCQINGSANAPSQGSCTQSADLFDTLHGHRWSDQLTEETQLQACFSVNLLQLTPVRGFMNCHHISVAICLCARCGNFVEYYTILLARSMTETGTDGPTIWGHDVEPRVCSAHVITINRGHFIVDARHQGPDTIHTTNFDLSRKLLGSLVKELTMVKYRDLSRHFHTRETLEKGIGGVFRLCAAWYTLKCHRRCPRFHQYPNPVVTC